MPPPAPRQASHSNVTWCHDLWQLHWNEYLSSLLTIAEPPVSFYGLHFEAPWSVWHHLPFPLSRPHRNGSFISAPQSRWLASAPSRRCFQEVRLPAYISLCSLHNRSSQVRFFSLRKLTSSDRPTERLVALNFQRRDKSRHLQRSRRPFSRAPRNFLNFFRTPIISRVSELPMRYAPIIMLH